MSVDALSLSDPQNRAIDRDKGHIRIVACPGSGKTEIVSRRVAALIQKGVEPSTIAAFAFTNKAAEDLKLRIRRVLDEQRSRHDAADMYVGTIDSFCLYLLKKIKPEYRSFEILDSARRVAFADRWYGELGLRDLKSGTKWATIAKFCTSVDRAVTEEVDMSRATNRTFVSCHKAYTKKLSEERYFDFVSVISTLLDVLDREPPALEQVNREVKHVVFDGYQDVNRLQENLLTRLSRGADSVCVVGDDDQNIFQWRGSDISHMLEFPSKHADGVAITERLGINYRATDALVRVAKRLAPRDDGRIEKDMKAYGRQANKFERGDIVCHHFDTDEDEFEFIYNTIDGLHETAFADKAGARPLSYNDMAVIVRTNEDAARVMSHMSGKGVPFVAERGSGVFNWPVVSLALNCLMYAFDKKSMTRGVLCLDYLMKEYSRAVPGGDAPAFSDGLEVVRTLAKAVADKGYRDYLPNSGLQEFYYRILNAMGAERGDLSEEHMRGLAALSAAISDYESVYRSLRARQVGGLQWFISQIADAGYADPARGDAGRADAVRILTIWAAKGLEFPVVFVPSFDKRKRPNPQPVFIDDGLYDKARYDGSEADDRRAYYTAVTRSQKYLFLTSAKMRNIGATRPVPKKDRAPHPLLNEMAGPEFSAANPINAPKIPGSATSYHDKLIQSSYSEISAYDRCPYDYKFRHVMGFSAGAHAAFGYGAAVRDILSYLHAASMRDGAVPDDGEIKRAFDRMFRLRFATKALNASMKNAGIQAVKNYARAHGRDFERVLGTGKRFELPVGGALISGSVDLLKSAGTDGKGSVEVIDFNFDQLGDDGQHDPDHSEQVRFCAYAVRASLGYRPETATVHRLHTQEKNAVDVNHAALDAARDKIAEKVGLIRAGRFDPTPEEAKCRGCDFRALCQHKGFAVGPGFPPESGKLGGRTARTGGDLPASGRSESPVSAAVLRKARKLAETGSVARNADGSYTVASSTAQGKSYTVSSDLKCTCKGFIEYPYRYSDRYPDRYPDAIPTCSHVEAVKIFSRT